VALTAVGWTRRLLRQIGVSLDPRRAVEELRTGEQQLVTIARHCPSTREY
jgi:ABC-type sugar transport system ATPase subunit